MAGRVDPIEALEDPADLVLGDADALVDDRDLDALGQSLRRHQHRGALAGVGDRVGDEVRDRGCDLLGVAEHLETGRAAADHADLCRVGVDGTGVDRALDDFVDRHWLGPVDRVPGLQPRQLDDLLHQPRQPLRLSDHPPAEPLHRLRVAGRVVHGLGEQPDRTDRGLELVAHVGDEVAPDRLDLTLAGAVLDQRQHQA